jgi:hypothetical protein
MSIEILWKEPDNWRPVAQHYCTHTPRPAAMQLHQHPKDGVALTTVAPSETNITSSHNISRTQLWLWRATGLA